MSETVTKNVHFLDDARERAKAIKLEWPLRLEDGRVIDEIWLRRLTGREVRGLQEAIMSGGDGDAAVIAAFATEGPEIIGALDQDDFMAVKAAAFDFLPRQIREALEAASHTGEALSGT